MEWPNTLFTETAQNVLLLDGLHVYQTNEPN